MSSVKQTVSLSRTQPLHSEGTHSSFYSGKTTQWIISHAHVLSFFYRVGRRPQPVVRLHIRPFETLAALKHFESSFCSKIPSSFMKTALICEHQTGVWLTAVTDNSSYCSCSCYCTVLQYPTAMSCLMRWAWSLPPPGLQTVWVIVVMGKGGFVCMYACI